MRMKTWMGAIAMAASSCTGVDPSVDSFDMPVVGGEPTAGFPATGILETGTGWCSATLVGCDSILTAAQCVCETTGANCQSQTPARQMAVYFQHAGVFEVSSVNVHPSYTGEPDGHDIALLR